MTRIGNYEVNKISDGKYSCHVTNGNMGACILDEAGYQKLLEKYGSNEDTVEISSKSGNKPNMSRYEADKYNLLISNPFTIGFADLSRWQETAEANRYYFKQDMKYLFGWAFMGRDEYQKFCDEYNQDTKTYRQDMIKDFFGLT